jgi:hypothetical protein
VALGPAGHIDELITDESIGSVSPWNRSNAGQAVALDGHGDFDHTVWFIGTGKFHEADLAHADAIDANWRSGRDACGIRQVEIDLSLGLQEGAAGQKVYQCPQNH